MTQIQRPKLSAQAEARLFARAEEILSARRAHRTDPPRASRLQTVSPQAAALAASVATLAAALWVFLAGPQPTGWRAQEPRPDPWGWYAPQVYDAITRVHREEEERMVIDAHQATAGNGSALSNGLGASGS